MGAESVDFIEGLICTKSVDDAPVAKEVSMAWDRVLWTYQVFMRTKKPPATWSHASAPPSGGSSALGFIDEGLVRGWDADFSSKEQSESRTFALCSTGEWELIRTQGREEPRQ